MTTSTNQPADTIRDGALKVTIWKNFGDKGTFYSLEPSRTYKQGEVFKDSHSLSGTEPIQMARLLHLAYTRIGELIQQDKHNANTEAAQ